MTHPHRRPPDFRSSGSYYHIVLSGNRREALFSTPDDRRALNKIAIRALWRFDATLHAYCLMTNHFRILVQIEDRWLIKALRRIVTRYARYRQRQLGSSGPLFERPYKAQRIGTSADFLQLLRSIHLSPVIANLVVTPDDYRWSSHRAYLGYKSVTWIATDFGLSLFAEDRATARVAYHRFMTEGIAADVGCTVDEHTSIPTQLAPGSIDPVAACVVSSGTNPPHPPMDIARLEFERSNTPQSITARWSRKRARRPRRFLAIY